MPKWSANHEEFDGNDENTRNLDLEAVMKQHLKTKKQKINNNQNKSHKTIKQIKQIKKSPKIKKINNIYIYIYIYIYTNVSKNAINP